MRKENKSKHGMKVVSVLNLEISIRFSQHKTVENNCCPKQ